ncbi:PP2C family protein-serine/threonine phosphatase [Streptomyces marispadix]|uniref:Serine/threonine-protein phosphatase n=1 Tax=Streptomyces marispadix TaxID=2922868 RepID=A0ABS9SSV5_9ACTN|nr:PP2C family protein-serine/threonine phosphatase [Streptomyces marispadix]MCH6159268.1 serine/threonine-protein phosphatase [Streptomyces marispadix]
MTGDQGPRICVASPGLTGPDAADAEPDARAMTRTAGAPAPGAGVWRARKAVAFTLPALWVVGVLAWELLLPVDTHCVALLAATPALACAGAGGRTGVWLAGVCALCALYPLGSVPVYEEIGGRAGMGAAIVSVAAASCFAIRRRVRLTDELARTREVATAAQQALIRPLPPRIEGFTVAAGYLSAADGAAVGGDLYDAMSTDHGVRVLIGDVRGHGLGAVSTVAAVLGSFREAAHDEPRLERVPHRLEQALDRHLAACRHASADHAGQGGGGGLVGGPPGSEVEPVDEEFVTVLLLEVRVDGTVVAVNCGHPWPYRLTAGGDGRCHSEPVSDAVPLPPLGMLPLPPEGPEPFRLLLRPGEALFLYTDGAEDARDSGGGCFPLRQALTAALAGGGARRARRPARQVTAEPADVVGSVRRSLLRHAGGSLPDDVALLALRNDRDEDCRVHGRTRVMPPPTGAEAQSACSCP